MKLLLVNMYKRLHVFFLLKIFYRDKPISTRYSSILEKADLGYVKRLNTPACGHRLTTNQAITFKNISLELQMDDFIRMMGTPYFMTTKLFKRSKQTLVIYRDKINEFNVQAVINSLDNNLLNCTYHIDIESPEKLIRLKAIIQERYQLEDIRADEFIVTDPQGNELHFNHIFNTTITYSNGSVVVKEKIRAVVDNLLNEDSALKTSTLEKVKYSF
jgi:hypothetical protein